MRDINAKIGYCYVRYEEIMGKGGLGELNNNRVCLIVSCVFSYTQWDAETWNWLLSFECIVKLSIF